jgi:hypothetical protein
MVYFAARSPDITASSAVRRSQSPRGNVFVPISAKLEVRPRDARRRIEK